MQRISGGSTQSSAVAKRGSAEMGKSSDSKEKEFLSNSQFQNNRDEIINIKKNPNEKSNLTNRNDSKSNEKNAKNKNENNKNNKNDNNRSVDCIVVAPEGTRSLSGQLLSFKKGPFYLWGQMGSGGKYGADFARAIFGFEWLLLVFVFFSEKRNQTE